ncbi:MAG: hypothetical protein R3Y28_00515 [Candidatus Gastranaerophilales bacterium]
MDRKKVLKLLNFTQKLIDKIKSYDEMLKNTSIDIDFYNPFAPKKQPMTVIWVDDKYEKDY